MRIRTLAYPTKLPHAHSQKRRETNTTRDGRTYEAGRNGPSLRVPEAYGRRPET